MATRHDPRELPQAHREHPDPWFQDLEPDHLAGQNIGALSDDERSDSLPASRVKLLANELDDFRRDELDEITVLVPGARLQANATYCDISDPHRPVFTASPDMVVPRDHYLVPKHSVAYEQWNRLIHRARS